MPSKLHFPSHFLFPTVRSSASMCWVPLLSYSRNIYSECLPWFEYGARCGNMQCRSTWAVLQELALYLENATRPLQWETSVTWGEMWAKGKEKQVFRGLSLDPPPSGFLTFLRPRSDPLVSLLRAPAMQRKCGRCSPPNIPHFFSTSTCQMWEANNTFFSKVQHRLPLS